MDEDIKITYWTWEGCICIMFSVTLQLNNFEQDITEYIINKNSRNEYFNKLIVEQVIYRKKRDLIQEKKKANVESMLAINC